MSTDTATQPRWRTTGQIVKIRELLDEIQQLDEMTATTCRAELNVARERNQLRTFDACSKAITDLIAAKRALRPAKEKSELPQVPAGRYALAKVEDPADFDFYQIEVSGTGFVTGYFQISDSLTRIDFKTLRMVLARIVEATPLTASVAYGKHFGICGVCGRGLTNQISREAGIGPVCASRIG